MICLICICGICSGCGRNPAGESSGPVFRVVTQISVFYQSGPITAQRRYTRDDKMQQILNYLRRIDPYGTPLEDPETADGNDFQIELVYSDGSKKQYHQRSNRYLQINGGNWRLIDPKKAEELSQILCAMESDP